MAEPRDTEEPQPPATIRERVERVVADLSKRGEVRTKDLQNAAREMAERTSRDRRELLGLLQKEIKRQLAEREARSSKTKPED